jgi:hypothetical protein
MKIYILKLDPMKKITCSILSILAFALVCIQSFAQEATAYQLPPQQIADLL